MVTYTARQFTWSGCFSGMTSYTSEASDLGWPPGAFPREFTVESKAGTKTVFRLDDSITSRGDRKHLNGELGWRFTAVDGRSEICVYND